MNIIQLILASIGAVVVVGFIIIAIGAAWLAWQVHRCERNEARAWQQERALREREDMFAERPTDYRAVNFYKLRDKLDDETKTLPVIEEEK